MVLRRHRLTPSSRRGRKAVRGSGRANSRLPTIGDTLSTDSCLAQKAASRGVSRLPVSVSGNRPGIDRPRARRGRPGCTVREGRSTRQAPGRRAIRLIRSACLVVTRSTSDACSARQPAPIEKQALRAAAPARAQGLEPDLLSRPHQYARPTTLRPLDRALHEFHSSIAVSRKNRVKEGPALSLGLPRPSDRCVRCRTALGKKQLVALDIAREPSCHGPISACVECVEKLAVRHEAAYVPPVSSMNGRTDKEPVMRCRIARVALFLPSRQINASERSRKRGTAPG